MTGLGEAMMADGAHSSTTDPGSAGTRAMVDAGKDAAKHLLLQAAESNNEDDDSSQEDDIPADSECISACAEYSASAEKRSMPSDALQSVET